MRRGLWYAMAGMESEKQVIERRIVLPLSEHASAAGGPGRSPGSREHLQEGRSRHIPEANYPAQPGMRSEVNI